MPKQVWKLDETSGKFRRPQGLTIYWNDADHVGEEEEEEDDDDDESINDEMDHETSDEDTHEGEEQENNDVEDEEDDGEEVFDENWVPNEAQKRQMMASIHAMLGDRANILMF